MVLYVIDQRGQLIVDKHNIASLMQRRAKRELAIFGLILQCDILPDDGEGGACKEFQIFG